MIHILYTEIEDNCDNALTDRCGGIFNDRFKKNSLDHLRTQLGRMLLKEGLQQFYDMDLNEFEILYSDSGKPRLANTNVAFNISHSEEIVVCALVSNGYKIGVDIEKKLYVNPENFKLLFTDEEWENMEHSDDKTTAFYRSWSTKEAALKTIGWGTDKLGYINVCDEYVLAAGEKLYYQEIDIAPGYVCVVSASKQSLLNNIGIHQSDAAYQLLNPLPTPITESAIASIPAYNPYMQVSRQAV